MLKAIIIRCYTKFQTTFLYKFKKAGQGLRLGQSLFVYPHKVSVGSRVYIGRNSYLDGEIEIGNDVMLASYVSIVGGDHRYDIPNVPIRDTGREHWKKTLIHDDAWIGHGAIILNGVTIGKGAVIGAGSIVTKDIPAMAIAYGSPARVVKYRFEK